MDSIVIIIYSILKLITIYVIVHLKMFETLGGNTMRAQLLERNELNITLCEVCKYDMQLQFV